MIIIFCTLRYAKKVGVLNEPLFIIKASKKNFHPDHENLKISKICRCPRIENLGLSGQWVNNSWV